MKRISFYVFFILALLIADCNLAISQTPEKPIFKDGVSSVNFYSPNEQREKKYAKLLSASVRISVEGSSGSGTICYYDVSSNFAYIVSCGHLWSGNKSHNQKTTKAKITTWYHNDLKLPYPKTYDAEAIFWSNERGYDVSLLRFSPDWVPICFPITFGLQEKKGLILNSMGCDGGGEVARYEVRFLERRGRDIITELNSPRPGRSGGGLITNEGELVGICWGTSDISSGKGIGYFTPVDSIKEVFTRNNHVWLLRKKTILREIPIYDWNKPFEKYDHDFIPVPSILEF
jgi:hypothetical protein